MQLSAWQILILAIVQGITEFLPISSSGHLVIAAGVLSPQNGQLPDVGDVNIVLHLGTLASILVFYAQRIRRLMGEDRRVVGLLVVGTLPAVIVGLPLKLFFDQVLESPLLAGCMLPVTGLILIIASRQPLAEETYQTMSYGRALLIGAAQALAILPGLSRSGTTIAAGMTLGLAPRSAATFSFLLAIPAIAGAGVLIEIVHLLKGAPLTTPWEQLVAGAFISFGVGLGALWWLVRWLEKGRLQWFAWWCIPVGVAVIVWQVWRMGR